MKRGKRVQVQNELSEERTELSNERTLLSYVQTSLAIFAFSFLILRVSDGTLTYVYLGLFSLLLGATFLIAGILKYKKRKKIIRKFKGKNIEFD